MTWLDKLRGYFKKDVPIDRLFRIEYNGLYGDQARYRVVQLDGAGRAVREVYSSSDLNYLEGYVKTEIESEMRRRATFRPITNVDRVALKLEQSK